MRALVVVGGKDNGARASLTFVIYRVGLRVARKWGRVEMGRAGAAASLHPVTLPLAIPFPSAHPLYHLHH